MKQHNHSHGHAHCHCHEQGHRHNSFLAPAVSLAMLLAGVVTLYFSPDTVTDRTLIFAWYTAAFLPVGLPVIKEAFEGILAHDYFNEFTLMSIACIGAFFIGEYPEAVGVMLLYTIGEKLQDGAVDKATRNISALLDLRSEHASVLREGKYIDVAPADVRPGETIKVNPGGRVPLDGILDDAEGVFDTAALTGESIPRTIAKGEEVLAGMISASSVIHLHVTREYGDSTLSRILDMVNNASGRKAQAELFIRRFARIYTPVVIILATLLTALPWAVSLFDSSWEYVFSDWLYRSLVFLVISCPCALVISVPLGYFAGIGAASRQGILFKGGNYLEAVTKVNVVAFDKTGTLTTGEFGVESIESVGMTDDNLLAVMAAAETGSPHPLANALVKYTRSRGISIPPVETMKEIAGHGTIARTGGKEVTVGNLRLLEQQNIEYPATLAANPDTVIVCAIDGKYAGCVTLSDTLKPDAVEAVSALRRQGVKRIVMLSGDKGETVSHYAAKVGITEAYGEMLPQDKATFVEKIANGSDNSIAFVGDGMNDAPVLALSNVGIAMGGLGSDAAIESADVVIQTDKPSKVARAIKIGRLTHTIVTQNIAGAIGIKALILILGTFGYASLWAAVFADVGVALLAVCNSMRILLKR